MALSATASQVIVEARNQSKLSNANLPHDNFGSRLNVIVWSLTGLAAIFLALRLYAKRIRHNKLWWDDYILIVAFVRELSH